MNNIVKQVKWAVSGGITIREEDTDIFVGVAQTCEIAQNMVNEL